MQPYRRYAKFLRIIVCPLHVKKADFGDRCCEFITTKQVTMAVLCSHMKSGGGSATLPSIQKWLSRSLQTCCQWPPRQPLGPSLWNYPLPANTSLMVLSPKWPSWEGAYKTGKRQALFRHFCSLKFFINECYFSMVSMLCMRFQCDTQT
jgi:hypothetical protein